MTDTPSKFAFDDAGEPRSAEEIARLEQEEEFNRQSAEEAADREAAISRQREKPRDPQKSKSYLPDIHRLLPASADAEQGILSSILLAPLEVMGYCDDIGVESAWFHIPSHKTIFEEMRAMVDERKPLDVITLTGWLRDRGLLDSVGGPAYVSEIFTFLPTAANASYYAEIAEEKWTLREMIRVCTEIAGRSYEEQDNPTGLLEELEIAATELALRRYKKRSGMVKDAVLRVIDKCAQGKTEEAWGLSTGYANLDSVIRGCRPGNLFAIGGETSSGKTSLALNLIHNICVKRKLPGLVFSLEMSTDEVTEVLLQIGSGVNVDSAAENKISDAERRAFHEAAEALAKAPVTIRDEKDVSIIQARSIARRLKPRIIVLDYAQLLTGGKKKYERADLEIADISRGAKKMAGELDATVFLLTQLNDDGKVAGSRTIAKDADQLLIVKDGAEGEKVVQVCKQRRGRKDEVPFRWIGACQKFLPKSV